VAAGHSKAVLTLDSSDSKLFTGSKDRTAKVWDLTTGQELAALAGHNNSVTKVRCEKNSQLCMTVSASSVKVWDLRESAARCVKSLCSSGVAVDGNTTAQLHMLKSSRYN
jgi:kinesin family protein 4/21/27